MLVVLLSSLVAGEDPGAGGRRSARELRGPLGLGVAGSRGWAAVERVPQCGQSAMASPQPPLSIFSLGQPVAARPGGLAGTGPGGAGLGCVGAPEPASTFRPFEKGASSCLAPASSASGGASEDREAFLDQLMNRSPLRRGRCPSCPQLLLFLVSLFLAVVISNW